MAEVVGLIASVITIGASAAQVSLALFSVVQTLKNAPKQIAEIAEELSSISESLQTLADVIDINRNVCRQAIFKNTHIIISRYKQVDAEIKKLIDTPQKLAGLQWYLNKPKAKGLMKKVEGIKVALILELNIIRLAREEFTRSFSETGASTLAGLPSKPNRFRKVVESAVQANRKVVENAQQDDEDTRAEKLPYANVGLDIWKQDSFDTATWLYHLVFSLDIPYPPETNSETRRLYQASVTDVSVSSDEEKTLDIPKADTDEKAMIVWNKQTEPSSVVDRLLSSWTTLSPDQITRSAANQDGDEWREGLLRNIEEAKKEDEKTYSDWEQDYLSESSMPTYNSPNTRENHRNRRESSAGPFLSRTGDSPEIRNPRSGRVTSSSSTNRKSGEKRRVRFPSHESSDVHSPPRPRYEIRPDRVRHSYRDDDSTSSRIHPPLSGWAASTASTPSRGFSNSTGPSPDPYPARSGYLPPLQDPLYGTQSSTFDPRPPNPFSPAADWANTPSEFSPNHAFVPPQHPQHPQYPRPQSQPTLVPHAQAPSTNDDLPPPRPPEAHPSSTETAAKEKAIMTAVEDLLERREQNKQLDASEPRFLRLMELFHTQQERELQNERERANTATEAQTKLMQSMHDKDKERLRQLETLVDELRNEEKKLRRLWQVETEEKVKEARDTVAKEIAVLQSAKEEAERQTQQRADTIMATELRKLKRDHKKELDRYEDQLREMQEQQAKREQDVQLPVRRTLIAEGNRSVDVTEYMSDQRNPFHTSPSHLKGLQHGFAQLGIDLKQRQAQHQHPRHSRRDSLHSSTASMQSSRASIGTANTPNPTGFSQQLIVFPAKANRESKEIATLQSSLASLGIDAVFEDPEYEHGSQLIPYNHGDSDDRLVRSTIFWEAPMLTIGSELLLTKRQVGWRPEYVRTSEKGQTHFYGSQPIHAYFFSPDYKPQFSQSTGSSVKESVLIHKSIVHEYALIELGLRYEATDSGNYVLDGRLTYHDIENLVERSFLINENHWRRMYRGLQGHFNKVAYQVPKSAYRFDTRYREANQPSTPYTPSAYSADEDFTNLDDNNYDTEDRESSVTSTATRRRRDDSDHSDWVSTTSRDESSAKSPSVFSASSKSTKNPFRQHMSTHKVDREEFESKPVSANIWDNTVPVSLI